MAKPANDDVPMFHPHGGLRHEGHPSRTFVSAARVYSALHRRFGCAPTGDAGAACTYWRTPNGKLFKVEDPVVDPSCASVLHADGRSALFYSYEYANGLLRWVSELCQEPPVPLRADESDLRVIMKPRLRDSSSVQS